jgi:hypothetical protein
VRLGWVDFGLLPLSSSESLEKDAHMGVTGGKCWRIVRTLLCVYCHLFRV